MVEISAIGNDGSTAVSSLSDGTSDDRSSLRADVLSGRFFGQKHEKVAGRLALFLHGALSSWEALEAWFGDGLGRILSSGNDALRIALDRDIAMIDANLNLQLDVILHAPQLLQFEGRWRGLAWLISGIEPGRRIKIRLLPVRWPELARDLERALEFDQSNTFKRIYEEEFGMPGGEPFGLMVIDHELHHRIAQGPTTDDVGTIGRLSAIAAAAFMPIVLSLHPSVLDVGQFTELDGVRDVVAPLRDTEHVRWRSLAGRPDMRFMAVTLPRLLARHPWTDDPSRCDGFRYREYSPDSTSRVWMNAAYAFAACAVRAFAENDWPADVRGVEVDRVGGGLVTDLPPEPFASGPPFQWPRTAIEYNLSAQQEQSLVDVGLMPVTALPFGPDMVFGAVRSMQGPSSYTGTNAAAAQASARLSAQVNSMLCASRFAHLLKVMGRDMVGSFKTSDEIERRLNLWLQNYVNTNIDNTTASRARYPLLEGEVQVRQRAGAPGSFGCVMRLRPHYQLDDVSTTFHFVTEIRAPGQR